MATHQSCSSIQSYLKSLLSLSLFIQIAISFVINPRNTSPLAGRPSHDGDDSYCADSPQWEYIGDQESDCLRAIRKLHDTEVSKHKDSEFEFLADNVQPHLSLAINRTPRKYMYNTCTVAIVNLNFFGPGELPGIKPWDWGTKPTSDLASYEDIWHAAQKVEWECVKLAKKSGWQPTGRHGGIGLFVWSTNSEMNRKIPGSHGPHSLHQSPDLGPPLNQTMDSSVPNSTLDWTPHNNNIDTA